MTRKIIHPNPASAATGKVVGPAPALKVVGPATNAKVVGPNGTSALHRVNGKVVGPGAATTAKVVAPATSAAVKVARPAPGANVIGPRPGASGAGAPAAPGAVVRRGPTPAAKVVGPGFRPANGTNGTNGHSANGTGIANGTARRRTSLPPKDRWLRVGEVAERFGVGPRTVKQWARKGRLPAVRTLGGHYRFPENAVRALLWRLSPAERSALEVLEASRGHADTWPVSQSVARALAGRGLVIINEAQASITKAGRQALAAARQAQLDRARVARP